MKKTIAEGSNEEETANIVFEFGIYSITLTALLTLLSPVRFFKLNELNISCEMDSPMFFFFHSVG